MAGNLFKNARFVFGCYACTVLAAPVRMGTGRDPQRDGGIRKWREETPWHDQQSTTAAVITQESTYVPHTTEVAGTLTVLPLITPAAIPGSFGQRPVCGWSISVVDNDLCSVVFEYSILGIQAIIFPASN